ncbi:MAG: UvrD-helicase domain-containing protein, partial [Candidatus Saccharimonadales bacterium]
MKQAKTLQDERYQGHLAALNKQQRLAVDTLDGPVLVIAGPGTGKTQLLSVRIAHILHKTDALPQNILCLTFSESAALNMRQRLVDIIGQAAYDVTISTYHAFGSDLIKGAPEIFNATGLNFNPTDELGSDQILRQIIDKLPYSDPLKRADNYIGDLKNIISDFKKALLTPALIKQLAKHNQQFIKTVTPMVQAQAASLARVSKASISGLQSLAAQTASLATEPTPAGFGQWQSLAHLWQKQLQAALEDFAVSGKTKSITAWKSAWLAKDDQARFIVAGQNVVVKLRAAADIYEQYQQQL